jgi:hypothetical protein
MAEDKVEGREATWRSLLPWTELFRGFQLALDLNKLLLAAMGIVLMAFVWWVLALIFSTGYRTTQPEWAGGDFVSKYKDDAKRETKGWEDFKKERSEWNLMHEAAGAGKPSDALLPYEVEDIAATLEEYKRFKGVHNEQEFRDAVEQQKKEAKVYKEGEGSPPESLPKLTDEDAQRYLARAPLYARLGHDKPAPGKLSTWPWGENRGPNPFLVVTGQAGRPWEAGHFWDWFFLDQVPVLIEPLIKFLRPIIYFFDTRATALPKFYFLLVTLATVAIWGVFGGAITRIAAVQAARGEKIGMTEALRFTVRRLREYILAPVFPLGLLFILLVLMWIFGYFEMIPLVGDLIAGLFWPGVVVLGLIMAMVLVGLVGWPLMSATISAEGTDSWEAVSRSYSYVYQKPWHYIWYSLVAVSYGALLVFFVGFMGSLMVYLSKWGVAHTPGLTLANREPSYLFIYAPESFEWRALLLQDARVEGAPVVQHGRVDSTLYGKFTSKEPEPGHMHVWNYIGAGLMAFWLGLIFLLIVGFGYSYFWSAGTLIYLLMRRNVDAADLDEVYLEEDEHEGPYPAAPSPAAPAPPHEAVRPAGQLAMVEPPTLRPVTPPAPAPSSAPVTQLAPTPAPSPPGLAEPPAEAPPPPEPPASPPEGGTPQP